MLQILADWLTLIVVTIIVATPFLLVGWVVAWMADRSGLMDRFYRWLEKDI